MTTQTDSAQAEMASPGKYLTFSLEREVYGIAILKVQEIIGVMPVTKVPRLPQFMRGVVNLRGKVIPIIDLRLKFGLEAQENTERTCFIVVQVNRNGVPVTLGIIVDEVSEVLDIAGNQIESAPSFASTIDTNFLSGMGKVSKTVVMLLDVDRALAGVGTEDAGMVGDF